MQIEMPIGVQAIIKILYDNGFEAYAVGGCVRDVVLGNKPHDWDITTSATPSEMKKLFHKTIDTGLQHGTITILQSDGAYETTTYRVDGDYEDHRRPTSVNFTRSLLEDLKRRDFTINAMAYNEQEGLVDPFNGTKDLASKVIRCVGNANDRFCEDALRMMRAIRFSAKLGFDIDKTTYKAIKKNAHLIENISAERIQEELNKTLLSMHPDYVRYLVDVGIMERIIPEFMPIVGLSQHNPHHIYNVDEHTYEGLKAIEPTKILRWTMFLHDLGKGATGTIDEKGIGHFYNHAMISCDYAKNIMDRLKFDNASKNAILKLVKYHDYRFEPKGKSVRKAMNKIGQEFFEDYLKVRRADAKAQNPEFLEVKLEALAKVEKKYREVLSKEECFTIKSLAINGKDLIALDIKEGKVIGDILEKLLEMVLDNPEMNEKEKLIQKALQLK